MKRKQKGVLRKKRRKRKRKSDLEKLVTLLSRRLADRIMKLAAKEGFHKILRREKYKIGISREIQQKNWNGLIQYFYVQMAWVIRYRRGTVENDGYSEVEAVGRSDFYHEANKFYGLNRKKIVEASFEMEAKKGGDR